MPRPASRCGTAASSRRRSARATSRAGRTVCSGWSIAMAGSLRSDDGPPAARRLLFALVWWAAVVAALAVLGWGIYSVSPGLVGDAACTVTYGLPVALGAIALGLIAGVGWFVMGS